MQKIVAGILVQPRKLLFAQRAKHQTYSGEWEFPGGKVEQGETRKQALARELYEEIGVQINTNNGCTLLLDHRVEEQGIHLYFYLIEQWRNQPTAREGQYIGWYTRPWCTNLPLLPTNKLLLNRLLHEISRRSSVFTCYENATDCD